ncbi:phage tail family protein [Dietzia cinnamea]|uniref:phage tail family protein n=2 Tax=Dietzia cinnamea TaxID=321318 RepID=UPI00223B93CC|nr:phage tail family protein [Dietzia cinnamea]MCT2219801.1 phage tail family protein [Dietzia cinnamea]
MRAWVNGFPLNDLNTAVFVHDAIEGLSVPAIRRATGKNMGQNGTWHGRPLFDSRNIGIPVTIGARNSIEEFEAARDALTNALLERDGEVELRLIRNDGVARILYCYVRDPDIPYGPNALFTRFSLELVADDPIVYDDTPGASFVSPLVRRKGGGAFTSPGKFPLKFTAGSGTPAIVNSGTVEVYPVIKLTGSMTTPTISNHTTGAVMTLDITTGTSDVVLINNAPHEVTMDNGTKLAPHSVMLNGSSVYAKKSGSWLSVPPGASDFDLTTGSTSDTVVGEVSWRSGYLSV